MERKNGFKRLPQPYENLVRMVERDMAEQRKALKIGKRKEIRFDGK